jgi:multidrug transporter EmrE-like cation transporter
MEYLFLPLILFELLGDFTLYKGSKKDEYIYVLYAIIIYSINIIIYFYLLKYYKNLGIVNGIWQGLMLFMITMISIFYFKDDFEYTHIVGLMFIFIGIILLNYKS